MSLKKRHAFFSHNKIPVPSAFGKCRLERLKTFSNIKQPFLLSSIKSMSFFDRKSNLWRWQSLYDVDRIKCEAGVGENIQLPDSILQNTQIHMF